MFTLVVWVIVGLVVAVGIQAWCLLSLAEEELDDLGIQLNQKEKDV
jgi:hypothetical protein